MSLLNKLIEQAKKPNGNIGSIMVSIMNSAHKKMTIWGLNHVTIHERSSVLDVGCGGGSTLNILSNLAINGEVIGVDYSIEAVKRSISRNRQAFNRGLVKVEHGNVEDLPFESEKFDIVTSVQSHYFWSDLNLSFNEIQRILKKDGKVLIIAENYKMSYHMIRYETSTKLKELLEQLGFRNIIVQEKNGWMCLVGTK